jgi:SagB-type dehydrogenase family enzyme
MRANRRSFLRLLAATIALLSGGRGRAEDSGSWNVHRATRNTRLGAVGALRPRLRSRPSPSKPYPGRPRVELPAGAEEPSQPLSQCIRSHGRPPQPGAQRLGLRDLSRLLHLTNGITDPARAGGRAKALRAAPSAGALYAGEVYVVAERVDGLAPGIYFYDVAQHALVVLKSGAHLAAVARALAEPGHAERDAAAILLTNVFDRYGWRYANRGYRYALIDSGHIGENLRLAAASAGFDEMPQLSFQDDRLNDLIGVDGHEEAVCAVHTLARSSAHRSAVSGPAAAPAAWAEKQHTALALRTGAAITQQYHDATKLVAAPPIREAPGPRQPPSPKPADIALPRREHDPEASVGASIRIRRSARRFGPQPMELADLGFLLEMAQGNPSLRRTAGIDVYLVAHRITNLAAGLYRFDASKQSLARLRAGDLAGDLVRVCLGQPMAGEAAAGFLMAAWLGPDGAYARTRRYRDLLLEAGAIGQRLYLAAEAVGLAARNLAAFVDDDLNGLMGLDGRHEAVVHLTLAGPGD